MLMSTLNGRLSQARPRSLSHRPGGPQHTQMSSPEEPAPPASPWRPTACPCHAAQAAARAPGSGPHTVQETHALGPESTQSGDWAAACPPNMGRTAAPPGVQDGSLSGSTGSDRLAQNPACSRGAVRPSSRPLGMSSVAPCPAVPTHRKGAVPSPRWHSPQGAESPRAARPRLTRERAERVHRRAKHPQNSQGHFSRHPGAQQDVRGPTRDPLL